MTRLQIINKTIKENPNIIGRKNLSKRVGSWSKGLSCMRCNKKLGWDTEEIFYLVNSHGWGYCDYCLNMVQLIDNHTWNNRKGY